MNNTDSIPIVSQAKSGVQWISGDSQAAKKTQENFQDQCTGFSQDQSLDQLYQGDKEGAKETQRKYSNNACMNDRVPDVGQVNGEDHEISGEKEGGNNPTKDLVSEKNPRKSTLRTIVVCAGGVYGVSIGGPIGSIAGGVVGGTVVDAITTVIESLNDGEFRPSGHIAAVAKMIKGEDKAKDCFYLILGIANDGMKGYVAGEFFMKIKNALTTIDVFRVVEKGEAIKAIKTQKIPRGYNQTPLKGETWVSESVEHSKEFLKQKQQGQSGLEFDVLKIKVKKEFLEDMKAKNMIQQQGSAALNTGASKNNLFNTEKLTKNAQEIINIGIKGDENLQHFNDNIEGIEKIDLTNANGQRLELINFAKRVLGVLVSRIRKANDKERVEPRPCL